jgi:hypothetical protein
LKSGPHVAAAPIVFMCSVTPCRMAEEVEANRLASRAFFFQKGIGLSAPQLDVAPTDHGAESGGVVVRVHLACADGY